MVNRTCITGCDIMVYNKIFGLCPVLGLELKPIVLPRCESDQSVFCYVNHVTYRKPLDNPWLEAA